MKRWLISLIVTPKRARSTIAHVVSWLLELCIMKGMWDVVSEFPKWLRRLADFIDRWNESTLPEDKDHLIADLVKDAVTDEAVDKLVDAISAMEVHQS